MESRNVRIFLEISRCRPIHFCRGMLVGGEGSQGRKFKLEEN